MSDLISRQAAIDAICEEGVRLERNGMVAMCEIKQWCIDLLDRLPSAQPERMKGRWIGSDDFDEYYRCSECGKGKTQFGELYRYCPNCGALMREDGGDG